MFKDRQFDQSANLLCVRWYLAYGLSLRDLAEIMAERGIAVDHTTIHRWAVRYAPLLLELFNRRKRSVTGKWHIEDKHQGPRPVRCRRGAGYKRVVMMVPNYQAGHNAVEGFRRHYRGEVLDEIYVPLGQLDFATELSKIRALDPDALLVFMPGGMGVTLVRQFSQSGMAEGVPFLSIWTVDETTLPATQEAAAYSASQWCPIST